MLSRNAECHYAECRYAECHGATLLTQLNISKTILIMNNFLLYDS